MSNVKAMLIVFGHLVGESDEVTVVDSFEDDSMYQCEVAADAMNTMPHSDPDNQTWKTYAVCVPYNVGDFQ